MTTLLILVAVLLFLSFVVPFRILAWFIVFFISDPAGVSSQYLDKNQLGGFFYIDIFLLGSFILLFTGKYKFRDFFKNPYTKGIFLILLAFSLYKVFVWGLILPEKGFSYFLRYCLVRERDSIFGFLFIIPVYLFAMKDLKSFLKIIVFVGLFLLVLAGLSFIFGLNLVQINLLERYVGSGIMRYYLSSYGLLVLLVPASITALLAKIPLNNKQLLYTGGVLTIISIIITLTKNQYLFLSGIILAAIFFTGNIFRLKAAKSSISVTASAIVVLILLNISFPKYSDYGTLVFKDIISLVIKGETSTGSIDRKWQIPALMDEIKRNPVFGTGQGYGQLNTNEFDQDQFDATDLPLLAHIMQYGIVGIFIYLLYYFKLFSIMKILLKRIMGMKPSLIIMYFKYEIIFAVASLAYFAGYFIRGYTVFIELTNGQARIEMSIYTGLLLACLERIRIKSQLLDTNEKPQKLPENLKIISC